MIITATSTEVQNNFGRYLRLAEENGEIIILRNGTEVARLISKEKSVSFLTDSLIGVLQNDYDEEELRKERMKKYESTD